MRHVAQNKLCTTKLSRVEGPLAMYWFYYFVLISTSRKSLFFLLHLYDKMYEQTLIGRSKFKMFAIFKVHLYEIF